MVSGSGCAKKRQSTTREHSGAKGGPPADAGAAQQEVERANVSCLPAHSIYEGAPRVKEKVWLVIFHFQLHFEHPDGGQGNAGERPERRSGGRDWCGGEDSRPTESKKSKNPILAGKR